jgi:hypoxanthine phosphoribosyltransferase
MKYVIDYLKGHSPNSIKTCVFLNKPSRRKIDLKPDYIGFDIPDIFIVGYGLNYGNYYRNMPYIFTFEEDN